MKKVKLFKGGAIPDTGCVQQLTTSPGRHCFSDRRPQPHASRGLNVICHKHGEMKIF